MKKLMPEQKTCCFVRVKSHWKGKHPTTVEEAASIRLVCSGWDNCGGALLRELLPSSDFFPCVLFAEGAHPRFEINCNLLGCNSKVALSWRSLGWHGHIKPSLDSQLVSAAACLAEMPAGLHATFSRRTGRPVRTGGGQSSLGNVRGREQKWQGRKRALREAESADVRRES